MILDARNSLAILVVGTLAACTSVPHRDYTYIENPVSYNKDPKHVLTRQDLKDDREKLLFTLNNIYSGSRFLPKEEFSGLISELKSIDAPITANEFCQAINKAFAKVRDSHLKAGIDAKPCTARPAKVANVGENFYAEKDGVPWATKIDKRRGKTALLISITSFPAQSSPKWDGLLDSVKKRMRTADLIILDMRGNGGGDDTMGYKLSELLAGRALKSPMNSQWRWNKPESFQVFVNSYQFHIDKIKESGKPVPPHLETTKQEFIDKRSKAMVGALKETTETQDDAYDFDPKLSVRKPIYILIDRNCASSCESTTDDFEYNTYVKTVGENSAGYLHFSNNGIVILPGSGVFLQFATNYNSYQDGRFLEKIGITPKLKTTSGTSALETAWQDYLGINK